MNNLMRKSQGKNTAIIAGFVTIGKKCTDKIAFCREYFFRNTTISGFNPKNRTISACLQSWQARCNYHCRSKCKSNELIAFPINQHLFYQNLITLY